MAPGDEPTFEIDWLSRHGGYKGMRHYSREETRLNAPSVYFTSFGSGLNFPAGGTISYTAAVVVAIWNPTRSATYIPGHTLRNERVNGRLRLDRGHHYLIPNPKMTTKGFGRDSAPLPRNLSGLKISGSPQTSGSINMKLGSCQCGYYS